MCPCPVGGGEPTAATPEAPRLSTESILPARRAAHHHLPTPSADPGPLPGTRTQEVRKFRPGADG